MSFETKPLCASSPICIPMSMPDMPKPDIYFIGCSWMTHQIIDTLCSYDLSSIPYSRIFLYDPRPCTVLERSRIARWHVALVDRNGLPMDDRAILETEPESEQVDYSVKQGNRTTSTPPSHSSTRHTLAQMCKIAFQDRIPSIPITVIDVFTSEFPPSINIINKILVYTDASVVSVSIQKRIEEQLSSSNQANLYYLFQNGLFAIYRNGYMWKNRYTVAHHITHNNIVLTREGCDLYVDYLRTVKKYKDGNIYDLPTRFYKYKFHAQCFPLGTILSMMFISGHPESHEYPYVFDYSALYSDTMIDSSKGKDDTGLIFPRETQMLLKDKVHWIQSFDARSHYLYRDLLSYLEWTCTISEKGKTTRVYLLCDKDVTVGATESTRDVLLRQESLRQLHEVVQCYPSSVSLMNRAQVHETNGHKGYVFRHADWVWNLDTTQDASRPNAQLTQLIYDYLKPGVVLSDIRTGNQSDQSDQHQRVSNGIFADIVMPKKTAVPAYSNTECISNRRMALKRMMTAFSFMNWIYLAQNAQYMEQFARSHRMEIYTGQNNPCQSRLTIVCPEEPRHYISDTEQKTHPYQFNEWFRWKVEQYRDGCVTVGNLVDYIIDTYEVYPQEIYYEDRTDCILYKKEVDSVERTTAQFKTNILTWMKRNVPTRTVIRSFDIYRFTLVCVDEKGQSVKVPPLYYCAP